MRGFIEIVFKIIKSLQIKNLIYFEHFNHPLLSKYSSNKNEEVLHEIISS